MLEIQLSVATGGEVSSSTRSQAGRLPAATVPVRDRPMGTDQSAIG